MKIKARDKLRCLSIVSVNIFIPLYRSIYLTISRHLINRNRHPISRFNCSKRNNKDQVCDVMKCHLTLEIETWSKLYQSPKGILFNVELQSYSISPNLCTITQEMNIQKCILILSKVSSITLFSIQHTRSRRLHISRQK